MVEISIDAGGKEVYEASRRGASYDLLWSNIERLSTLKAKSSAKVLISARIMVKPSTVEHIDTLRNRLRGYCDSVIVQHLTHQPGMPDDADLYKSTHLLHSTYPLCSYPSRAMQIKTDGTIPVCPALGHDKSDANIVAGNICSSTLEEIWHSPQLRIYREAHRNRDFSRTPECKGCLGA